MSDLAGTLSEYSDENSQLDLGDVPMIEEQPVAKPQVSLDSQIFTQVLPLIGKIPMCKPFFEMRDSSVLHPALFCIPGTLRQNIKKRRNRRRATRMLHLSNKTR